MWLQGEKKLQCGEGEVEVAKILSLSLSMVLAAQNAEGLQAGQG